MGLWTCGKRLELGHSCLKFALLSLVCTESLRSIIRSKGVHWLYYSHLRGSSSKAGGVHITIMICLKLVHHVSIFLVKEVFIIQFEVPPVKRLEEVGTRICCSLF